MGLLKKVNIINKLAYSKAKEKVKYEYLSRKAKKNNEKISKELIEAEERGKRETYLSELKNEITISKKSRAESNKDLSLIERVQKEFKSIPVISVVDDMVEGASQIEKIKIMVENNPDDPLSWLILAECIKYYKKVFLFLNLAKAPIDPLGTAMDIGVEFGGEVVESALDKNKWTYKRALLKSINIGLKSGLKDEKNLVCIGRSAQLISLWTKDPAEKENYLILSKKYLNEALKIASPYCRNEILYYLGLLEKNKVRKFKYSYNINKVKAIINGGSNAAVNQGTKMVNTIEKVLDNTLDKLIKERKL
ncbi:hypothetical protein KQI86_11345 [Clostridium sp. MSJ-11]|uniref:Uncharacterized protein n=1 Tax=Clostridium mobile TaxID=2841512 RepID=A0ABS6EJS6_9CLOT|nr:hypothetical protein [Clostridium mobile]MBU5484931.1 hypothetical protein [Clostridium mobile]